MLFSSFEYQGTRSALVVKKVRRRESKKENSGRRRKLLKILHFFGLHDQKAPVCGKHMLGR
jgi:hypothetical protein